MISDWVLCICLFAVCPVVILFTDHQDMTPVEYVFGGLRGLLQSVLSFVGLVSLAVGLLAFGILLLVGFENARGLVANTLYSDVSSQSTENLAETSTKAHSHVYTRPKISCSAHDHSEPRSAMRPYKVAKARHHSDGEKITGLVFVMISLAMLWLVPSYFIRAEPSQDEGLIIKPPPSHTVRKLRMDESQSGQTVLGMLTLAILLLSFALLKPGKERATKTAASATS